MAFPSELPAMRRLCLPAPNPLLTAVAWAGVSYVLAQAIARVPLAQVVSGAALPPVSGPLAAAALGMAIVASLVPAMIIAVMLRRAPAAWSESRLAATYLAILALVLVFQIAGLGGDTSLYSALACCGAGGSG